MLFAPCRFFAPRPNADCADAQHRAVPVQEAAAGTFFMDRRLRGGRAAEGAGLEAEATLSFLTWQGTPS